MTRKQIAREIDFVDNVMQMHFNDYSEETHRALQEAVKLIEQEPSDDVISREPFIDTTICTGFSCDECSFNRKDKSECILEERVKNLPSAKPQEPRKGHWIRMSDLSEQEDDRYQCSRCKNVVHYKDKMNLYTFNSWCGRCGSDNGRKEQK